MSPFQSEAQRRYLHIHEPEVAERWEHKYGSKPIHQKPHLRRNKNGRYFRAGRG